MENQVGVQLFIKKKYLKRSTTFFGSCFLICLFIWCAVFNDTS